MDNKGNQNIAPLKIRLASCAQGSLLAAHSVRMR